MKQLTIEQRYQISVLLDKNYTNIQIAEAINVHPSTISREFARNSIGGRYIPLKAQEKASERRKDRGAYKFGSFKDSVDGMLNNEWSPEQIVGHLKEKGSGGYICHETIYKYIRIRRVEGFYMNI